MHENDIVGRGISFMDAVTLINGKIQLNMLPEMYRDGTLAMMRTDNQIVPILTYDENGEKHLCVAFQRKAYDGKYDDFDIATITEALRMMLLDNTKRDNDHE